MEKKIHRASDFSIDAYRVVWKEFGTGQWTDPNEVVVGTSHYVLHFEDLPGGKQADAIFHLLHMHNPDRFRALCEQHSRKVEPVTSPPGDVRPHFRVASPEDGWRQLLPPDKRG